MRKIAARNGLHRPSAMRVKIAGAFWSGSLFDARRAHSLLDADDAIDRLALVVAAAAMSSAVVVVTPSLSESVGSPVAGLR